MAGQICKRELVGTAAVIRSHHFTRLSNHSAKSVLLEVSRVLGSLCEHFCRASISYHELLSHKSQVSWGSS